MMMSYNEILKIFSVGKGNFEKKTWMPKYGV